MLTNSTPKQGRESLLGRQLFLGNLPTGVGWQDIKDLMRAAGSVVRVNIMSPTPASTHPPSTGTNSPGGTGQSIDVESKGYAIVLFGTARDARKAVELFDGHLWHGHALQVREDRSLYSILRPLDDNAHPCDDLEDESMLETNTLSDAADVQKRQVTVSNLPYIVGWQDLKDLFREAGSVLRADIKTESKSGKSKGIGVVLFQCQREADLAHRMFDGFEWFGRRIEVSLLHPGQQQQHQSEAVKKKEESAHNNVKSWADKVREKTPKTHSYHYQQQQHHHHGTTDDLESIPELAPPPPVDRSFTAHYVNASSPPLQQPPSHLQYAHSSTTRPRSSSFSSHSHHQATTVPITIPRSIPQPIGHASSRRLHMTAQQPQHDPLSHQHSTETSFSLPSSFKRSCTPSSSSLSSSFTPSSIHISNTTTAGSGGVINPFSSPPGFLLQPRWSLFDQHLGQASGTTRGDQCGVMSCSVPVSRVQTQRHGWGTSCPTSGGVGELKRAPGYGRPL